MFSKTLGVTFIIISGQKSDHSFNSLVLFENEKVSSIGVTLTLPHMVQQYVDRKKKIFQKWSDPTQAQYRSPNMERDMWRN